MMPRGEAVLIDAVRTPIGRYGGVLRDVRPDDLSALVLRALIERVGLDPARLQDIIWGCANQAGEDNRNVARMSALLAGIPYSVPATTVNRLCGSSLDAVCHADRAIRCGDAGILIAGGVESMSRAPYSVPKNQSGSFGNVTAYDTALGWRYPNPRMSRMFPLESMGETAENVAEHYKISREDQDAFACNSHRKALGARQKGAFLGEIIPVDIQAAGPMKGSKDPSGHPVVREDEGPRPDTTVEKLSALPPVFRKGGTVTAGNSSSLNDGAAAVLIASEGVASAMGWKPLARIVSTAVAGVDPRMMGMGPVPAVEAALERAGLTMNHIDLIELNEAFASQSIAVSRELHLDPEKLNVNGGAIALGHPLGCSGARILTTLLHEMARRKSRYGLAAMCIGVGQGIAAIVEGYS
jgi:3-oxoadipyl-CoA thiolase